MLRQVQRKINKRYDETSPKVYSHQDWSNTNYQFDKESFNYDNFEVAPIEDEQSAYLSMCALANYSQGAISSLGGLSAGTVQNVNLSQVDSHKACLAGIGSTMETTIQNMGNALNVRYKSEMENAGLFGGSANGAMQDYAAYLREVANQNTTDILGRATEFSQILAGAGGGGTGMQYDESVFTDPDKLASTYGDISKKDPSSWTEEEKYIVMAYYDDLAGRAATEKAKADEAGLYSYDPSLWDDYNVLAAEQKALEKTLKAEGMMEYTGWEKGWQEIKAAGKALVGEGADVLGAVKDGDWKGAWRELSDFNNQLQATGAVVTEAAASGVLKIGEYINDGTELLLTTAATPVTYVVDKVAGTDVTGQMWDATMDDVARDKVGEARDWFLNDTSIGQGYRDWTNENSAIARDGAAYGLLEDGATKVGEIALAAGITVATGGAAAPLVAAGLGFLEGTGQEAERRYNLTDENGNYTNRSAKDTALSYLKGIGKASEWYMYGNVGSSIVNGLGKAGAAGALDTAGLTGNNARDALTRLVKSGDFYLDVASSAANATSTRLTTGKWNWGEMALDFGLSILGNYGGEYLGVANANKAARAATHVDDAARAANHADDIARGAAHSDEIINAQAMSDAELAGVWGGGDKTPISPNTDKSVFSPAKQAQLDQMTGSSGGSTRFHDFGDYDEAVNSAKVRMTQYDPRLTDIYDEGKATGATKPHFLGYEEHNYIHVTRVADESKDTMHALEQLIDEGNVSGLGKLDDGIIEASGLCHDTGMRAGGKAIPYNKKTGEFGTIGEIVDDNGDIIRGGHPSKSAVTVLENQIGGDDAEMVAALDFLHSKSNSGVKNIVSDEQLAKMLQVIDENSAKGANYAFDITKFGTVDGNGTFIPDSEQFAKLKSGAIALRVGDARAAKTGFNQAGNMIDIVQSSDPSVTINSAKQIDFPSLSAKEKESALSSLCDLEAEQGVVDIVTRDGTRTAVAGGQYDFSRKVILGESNCACKPVYVEDGMLVYVDEVLTEQAPASTLVHGLTEKFGEYASFKDIVKQKQIIQLPSDCSEEVFNFYKGILPQTDGYAKLQIDEDSIVADFEKRTLEFIFGGTKK